VWLIVLSDQLLIVGLVSHYPTNYANQTRARSFGDKSSARRASSGISTSFPELFRTKGYVPTCYSPVCHSPCGAFDLHVLGLPPAFALSQDQTVSVEEKISNQSLTKIHVDGSVSLQRLATLHQYCFILRRLALTDLSESHFFLALSRWEKFARTSPSALLFSFHIQIVKQPKGPKPSMDSVRTKNKLPRENRGLAAFPRICGGDTQSGSSLGSNEAVDGRFLVSLKQTCQRLFHPFCYNPKTRKNCIMIRRSRSRA